MTVVGSTGGRGTNAIRTKVPEDTGLTVGTTKQEGRQIALVPEDGTNVQEKDREGLDI